MMEVGMHEAKTKLSELVRRVRRGERVYLTNHGEVVAEIIAPAKRRKKYTQAMLDKLRKRAKEHPLGTFEELMAWRREGLR